MKVFEGTVVGVLLSVAVSVGAQSPVGALAVDERQGERYGWAVDYETAASARSAALRECGLGCSVVLTFERCAAYAADQDLDSTAVGWAESYGSVAEAQQAALGECSSRGGGSGCVLRAWGCNGPVVEGGLGLDRAARQEIQRALRLAGFDPGGTDGLFGPRTRAAIRDWQTSRGSRTTGYLDGASVTALRPSSVGQPTSREQPVAGAAAGPGAVPAGQQAGQPPAASSQVEVVFWQSIVNSPDPADFEAYLEQFPNGVFRRLAENRLSALRSPTGGADRLPGAAAGSPSVGPRVSGVSGVVAPGLGATVDSDLRPGDVFRDCAECPEMVVLPEGGLAMGRYEVTVGEYRAFASATGGGGSGCYPTFGNDDVHSWQDPGFSQTDRHPVTCVNWNDAQEYLSWLGRRTGSAYRLPTAAEWERAAAGSQVECHRDRTGREGTCPVGSYGSNAAGLSDMVGNVHEWTSDCEEGDCGSRALLGGGWMLAFVEWAQLGWEFHYPTDDRRFMWGFRVSRTLD